MPIQENIEQLIRVLPDQRALTRRKFDATEVMPARIAIVDLDSHFPRSFQRPQAELNADIRQRRNISDGMRDGIDNEQVIVLIARLVVEKHQEAAVGGPILPVDWSAPESSNTRHSAG